MPFFSGPLAKVILLAIGMVALPACQSRDEDRAGDSSIPEVTEEMKDQNENLEMIEVQLTADPVNFPISDIETFQISISATNQGADIIDPELYRARLSINGQDSLMWSDTISNGRREEKWFSLPPGETVSMSWSSIGQFLFPAPGEYTLELHYGNQVLSPVQINVLSE